MADRLFATAHNRDRSGLAPLRFRLRSGACALLALCPAPALAQSTNVRISKLSDVTMPLITDLTVDASSPQSVCVFSSTATSGYRVTASGTGTAGAFTLASTSSSLAYTVQWNSLPGRTSGTQLTANVPLTGLTSTATQQACTNGPATSASLIVVLRSAALSSAKADTYQGTLTLVIGPE